MRYGHVAPIRETAPQGRSTRVGRGAADLREERGAVILGVMFSLFLRVG